MLKYKNLFISAIMFTCLANSVYAANLQDAFNVDQGSNLGKAAGGAGYDTAQTDFDSTIANIINAALSLVGIVFLALMIYGGFLWMTAKGDEAQVTKAKNLIIAAVIGLVIVIAAYSISYFVISTIGGKVLKDL